MSIKNTKLSNFLFMLNNFYTSRFVSINYSKDYIEMYHQYTEQEISNGILSIVFIQNGDFNGRAFELIANVFFKKHNLFKTIYYRATYDDNYNLFVLIYVGDIQECIERLKIEKNKITEQDFHTPRNQMNTNIVCPDAPKKLKK